MMPKSSEIEGLTDEDLRALSALPIAGFPLGSNMWPLVHAEGFEPPIHGEHFDALLRRGFAAASLLDAPMITDRTPNPDIAPDCEVTHWLTVTDAGRAALSARPRP
jgi:hypothetical protein